MRHARIALLALLCLSPLAARAQDAGVGLLPVDEFTLCDSGMSAAGSCSAVFTNLGASFVAVTPAQPKFLELARYHQVQVEVQMSVTVATGDIRVQCDTDSAFGSPTTLISHSIGTGTATQFTGWYDMTVGDECTTAAGVYLRFGLLNGDGAEDPRIAFARLQLR
jgi:hypothetical protein